MDKKKYRKLLKSKDYLKIAIENSVNKILDNPQVLLWR